MRHWQTESNEKEALIWFNQTGSVSVDFRSKNSLVSCARMGPWGARGRGRWEVRKRMGFGGQERVEVLHEGVGGCWIDHEGELPLSTPNQKQRQSSDVPLLQAKSRLDLSHYLACWTEYIFFCHKSGSNQQGVHEGKHKLTDWRQLRIYFI